ncbi:unnamed protein product [Caenorhabditis sp. 36 PRJEB53466]|nr:unnamed protein product [Caenorhabditis sp. 36 PRJEB53466]
MEKNGVFSRVRSRWRSIFSKKANPVKIRDCNRLTFERILSDPNEQIGTILAQATVEPINLPNGGGIALIQETTVYEEEPVAPVKPVRKITPSHRFRRLSSGDLNVIRRMTEEINFDLKLQNVIYDGNEITGETDEENGVEKACFKPGPFYPTDQQMMFLKQCLKKVETRPPNMYYLTNGWTVDNFEALFKYIIRSGEDCVRESLLSIEFRNCVVSLGYLHQFIEEYAAFKGVKVKTDYVYATIHSRKASLERKLRGEIEPFVEVEARVRKARISYTSTFILNSPHTPNVTVVVRFCCSKPCNFEKGKKNVQISVQVDHLTGHPNMEMNEAIRFDGIACECLEVPVEAVPPIERTTLPIRTIVTDRQMIVDDEEVPLQLSYHIDEQPEGPSESTVHVENDQTDITIDSALDCDCHEYTEMFPALLELFEKAGIKEIGEEEGEDENIKKLVEKLMPKKKVSLTEVDVSSNADETDEETQSITSSSTVLSFSSVSVSSSESDDDFKLGAVTAMVL